MDLADLFKTVENVRKQGEQIGELRIQEAVYQWVRTNADDLTVNQIKSLRAAIKLGKSAS